MWTLFLPTSTLDWSKFDLKLSVNYSKFLTGLRISISGVDKSVKIGGTGCTILNETWDLGLLFPIFYEYDDAFWLFIRAY